MSEPTIKLVAFCGSLRKASFNRMALHAFIERLPQGVSVETIEIGDWPLYNADIQAQGFPGRLTFTGRATRYNRDSVNATLSSGGGTHANATIYLDRGGSVDRIDMNGSGRDGDFRLNWRSR